jgi:Bacterial toxin 50
VQPVAWKVSFKIEDAEVLLGQLQQFQETVHQEWSGVENQWSNLQQVWRDSEYDCFEPKFKEFSITYHEVNQACDMLIQFLQEKINNVETLATLLYLSSNSFNNLDAPPYAPPSDTAHRASVPPSVKDSGTASSLRIEEGKQGKHILGHNNFILGKSELTHPNPQQLLNRFAGQGQPLGTLPPGQAGYKERVNFGEIIGNYVDPSTQEKNPTSNGIIHYSRNGAHIVPARP